MIDRTKQKRTGRETNIEKAISTYLENQYSSPRKATDTFKALFSPIQLRINRRTSRSITRESQHKISNVEETTLVRWIVRLARTGYPMSPSLVIEIAEEIRRARVQLSRTYLFHLSIYKLFLVWWGHHWSQCWAAHGAFVSTLDTFLFFNQQTGGEDISHRSFPVSVTSPCV